MLYQKPIRDDLWSPLSPGINKSRILKQVILDRSLLTDLLSLPP